MRARSRSPARRGAIRGDAGARCKGGQAARKLHAGAIFKRPSTAEVVADILQGEASQELRAERKAPPQLPHTLGRGYHRKLSCRQVLELRGDERAAAGGGGRRGP